jgi:nicotinamidase-related amidase
MGRKAVLVIDMQKDLCYDDRRKNKVIKLLDPLIASIELFQKAQYPIYYICFALQPDDEQFDRFGDTYCIEGTDGAEIIPELYPLRGPVIYKTKHSAFFETDLDERLKKDNVKEIYLTGMQTQICIMTTAADANFRGYKPVAISDCVLSTREENKIQALEWIEKYVGDVKSLTELAKEFENEQGESS